MEDNTRVRVSLQNRMSNSENNKESSKEFQETLINTITDSLLAKKLKQKNHILPKNEYTIAINRYISLLPGLTISMLKNRLSRRYKKHPYYKNYNVSLTVLNPPPPVATTTNIEVDNNATLKKNGRPKGTTIKNINNMNELIANAKNEITALYEKRRLELGLKKKVGDGAFNNIVKEIIAKYDLPDTFTFEYKTAMKRISRRKTCIAHGSKGPQSPLEDIEDDLVQFIILLGDTGAPLTPPQVLQLANSLIKDTPTQQKLIDWKTSRKMKGSDQELGTVGLKYLTNFMKRNKDKLRSKRGKRFELNRDKWQTYTNFKLMYEDHEEEMIDAGVAEKLPTPVWMNAKGDVCAEVDAVGCKVQTNLIRPDLCIVMDEVGANTSQINDGHVGGTRYVVGKDKEARQLSTKKDKRFTCLGLTTLDGNPLMCVVIIEGKQRNLLVESGIDLEAIEINNENESQHDHYLNNLGHGKKYPTGPSCTYHGIEVPCMVEFAEGGGINPTILTNIFRTLDALKLFDEDRKKGLRPYVILDGHQSRFDVEFLSYMNSPEHRWSVVIGVPYGTALWQVGDSRQQNGMFKVFLVKRKEYIMRLRERLSLQLEILPTDIIPLIIYAWNHSFLKTTTNIQAIQERGWFPLNRALLLHPLLRATMTNEEKEEEKKSGLVSSIDERIDIADIDSHNLPSNSTSIQQQATNNTNNITNNINVTTTTGNNNLNFSSGLGARVLDRLVSKNDLIASRKRNICSKREGENMTERMRKMTRKSAAQLVTVGQTHVLGVPLLNRVKIDIQKIKEEQQEVKVKKEQHYRTICKSADDTLFKKKGIQEYTLWSRNDLVSVIKPVKQKKDGPLPSKKSELIEMWKKVKGRARVDFDTSILPLTGVEVETSQDITSNDVEATDV
jgi:hypothetical protein